MGWVECNTHGTAGPLAHAELCLLLNTSHIDMEILIRPERKKRSLIYSLLAQ